MLEYVDVVFDLEPLYLKFYIYPLFFVFGSNHVRHCYQQREILIRYTSRFCDASFIAGIVLMVKTCTGRFCFFHLIDLETNALVLNMQITFQVISGINKGASSGLNMLVSC